MPAAPATPMPLPGGIYCPVVTFFQPTKAQELDIDAHKAHCAMLASAGVAGVVVMGSTGEAVTLSRAERSELLAAARPLVPILIAGTVGAQSTAQALELAADAAEARADYILVLPPSYYASALDTEDVLAFYTEVADGSSIPLIIYSYPAVSGGINLDSDTVAVLAAHPNIAGIKHTDHDVGKIARLATRDLGSSFTVLGGATDYLIGALAYGGEGAITGLANVAPRVCLAAYEAWKAGDNAKALKYAAAISRAEWSLGRGGILGTKYATTFANGYAAQTWIARRPLPAVSDKAMAFVRSECEALLEMERALESAQQ